MSVTLTVTWQMQISRRLTNILLLCGVQHMVLWGAWSWQVWRRGQLWVIARWSNSQTLPSHQPTAGLTGINWPVVGVRISGDRGWEGWTAQRRNWETEWKEKDRGAWEALDWTADWQDLYQLYWQKYRNISTHKHSFALLKADVLGKAHQNEDTQKTLSAALMCGQGKRSFWPVLTDCVLLSPLLTWDNTDANLADRTGKLGWKCFYGRTRGPAP